MTNCPPLTSLSNSREAEWLRLALRAGQLGTWEWNPATGETVCSSGYDRIYGYVDGPPGRWDYETCLAHILPEDRDAVDAAFRGAIERGEDLRMTYRIRRADTAEVRWIEVTGTPWQGATDVAPRVLGVIVDVTDRRQAEEQNRLLLEEMSHRIRNTFATVQALATLTGQGKASVEAFLQDFRSRLAALARAHGLLEQDAWSGAMFHSVIEAALEPWAVAGRIAVSGPDAMLSARQMLALSLGLHELATNASKHGALSVPSGQVTLRWSQEASGRIEMHWIESGGPPAQPPKRRGFGSKLLMRVLPSELGGTVDTAHDPAGLQVRVRFVPRGGPAALAAGV